jgi:hypothetical protein
MFATLNRNRGTDPDILVFWQRFHVAIIVVVVLVVVVGLINRYWELDISRKGSARIPGFIRAIYARKLEATGNVWHKKSFNQPGHIGIVAPFATEQLMIDPLFIATFTYFCFTTTDANNRLITGFIALILTAYWLYWLIRITIPGLARKRYWQSK